MKKRMLYLLLLAGFYLGLHNRYLALFEDGKAQPMLVLPYKADAYSQEDQAALAQGIPYENQEQLTRLLEDFLS